MPSYIICPNCPNNVPTKYKQRKERKEIIDPICDGCPNKRARKKYEEGIKKGIWMNNFERARKSLTEAITEFNAVGNHQIALILEIMSLMSTINLNPSQQETLGYLSRFLSSEYKNTFFGKGFDIPEFYNFDQIIIEAEALLHYFNAHYKTHIDEKVKSLQEASRKFFEIGYRQLFFSKALLGENKLNTQMALLALAESEEILAEKSVQDDLNEASFHFEAAITSYVNLENYPKAKAIRMRRSSLIMERTCWICGVRARGYMTTFRYVFTRSNESNYNMYKNLLSKKQEFIPHMHVDTVYVTNKDNYVEAIDSFDVKNNYLTKNAYGVFLSVCKPCMSIIEELSDVMAEKRIEPLRNTIFAMQNRIASLESSVAQLTNAVNRLNKITR